jgi:hypothetical protein
MAIIKELDPVQGLIDYILDVKPFHTKVVEVLTEYVHTDGMTVSFVEQFDMEIQLEYPSLFDLEQQFQDSGSVNIEVHSPDPTNDDAFVGLLGYDDAGDRLTVLGDRSDVLIESNTLLVKLTDDNDFLIHTASLTIESITVYPADPAANPPTSQYTEIHVPGLQDVATLSSLDTSVLTATLAIPGSVLSTGNIGVLGTYGGITPYGAPSAWPIISYDTTANGPHDPAALGYDSGNDQVYLPGDRRTEYTIGKSVEVRTYSIISGLVDTTEYDILNATYNLPTTTTEQQHTILTLEDSNTSGGLKSIGSLVPSGQTIYDLYSTVTLTPFPISGVVLGYASGSSNVIMYDDVPRSDDPISVGPNLGGLTQGDQINPTVPNENNFVPTRANSFIMFGDVSDIFIPGSIVEVVGTDYIFQVLQTTYDGTHTFLRVIETIQPGVYSMLKIRENLVGYGDIFTSAAKSDGTLSTNIVEAVTFSWADDGERDVIDGYQFLIIEAIGNTITVNGFAEAVVTNGDQVQILSAPANNGQHTITGVSGSTITLSTPLANSSGGWIEKYNP